MPGAWRFIGNLAAFHEAYGLKPRLAAEYVNRALLLGGSKDVDKIQDGRLTMDFDETYEAGARGRL